MKIERHETGPLMSKVVIHGDTVYLAGIVADSPRTRATTEICGKRPIAFLSKYRNVQCR